VDKINERFLDRWVLTRVTAFDDIHVPSEGVVVASSADDRDKITLALARVTASDLTRSHYEVRRAHHTIRSGPEVEAAVEGLVEQFNRAKQEGVI